ncbi:30S ribosome-binding factor RbfA [Buchnera aphidicola (Takecallis taiwana)]|uniref:30S ribosome-binding factor RbfA n=1 Tax=Buchnera aphidicola TaxID=9 RepID=UPI0031B68B5D
MKLLHNKYQKHSYRSMRIAEELKKAISNILQNQFRDPRINAFITVSMVKMSRDLSCAKIFISYMENSILLKKKIVHKNINDDILHILQKASGYIRRVLCQIMQLRKIPVIIFYNDNSLIQGMKIVQLLKKI